MEVLRVATGGMPQEETGIKVGRLADQKIVEGTRAIALPRVNDVEAEAVEIAQTRLREVAVRAGGLLSLRVRLRIVRNSLCQNKSGCVRLRRGEL
jgi:hypothetical protein